MAKRIPYTASGDMGDLFKKLTRGSGISMNDVIDASVAVYIAYAQEARSGVVAAKIVREVGDAVREAMHHGLSHQDVIELILENTRARMEGQAERGAPLKSAGDAPPPRPLDRIPDYHHRILPYCRDGDGKVTPVGRKHLEATEAEIAIRQQFVGELNASLRHAGMSASDAKLAEKIRRAASGS